MIYLGVDLSYRVFDISGISDTFACLERSKNFYYEDRESLKSWIKSFLLSDSEKIVWFFCENNYLTTDYVSSLFFTDFGDHYHFLVKDRVVLDLYQTVSVVNEVHNNRLLLEIPLILALSKKLINEKYFTQVTECKLTT